MITFSAARPIVSPRPQKQSNIHFAADSQTSGRANRPRYVERYFTREEVHQKLQEARQKYEANVHKEPAIAEAYKNTARHMELALEGKMFWPRDHFLVSSATQDDSAHTGTSQGNSSPKKSFWKDVLGKFRKS